MRSSLIIGGIVVRHGDRHHVEVYKVSIDLAEHIDFTHPSYICVTCRRTEDRAGVARPAVETYEVAQLVSDDSDSLILVAHLPDRVKWSFLPPEWWNDSTYATFSLIRASDTREIGFGSLDAVMALAKCEGRKKLQVCGVHTMDKVVSNQYESLILSYLRANYGENFDIVGPSEWIREVSKATAG